jgi:regulator of protease activity HflC (stomatin/prohibitin superfamily)
MAVVVLFVDLVIVAFCLVSLARSVKTVPQGFGGVITRFGRYEREVGPGICLIWPFFDRLFKVDLRETVRTGGPQPMVTRDGAAVTVTATIRSQVVDPRAALFNVADHPAAVDQQARTALRSAFGTASLGEALAQGAQIGAAVRQQMQQVTDRWGIRINGVDIVDVSPARG